MHDRPPIDPAKRARRQHSVDEARGSVRLEGFILNDDIEEISRRYVEGELSGDEHVAAIQAAVGVGPSKDDRRRVVSPSKIAAGLTERWSPRVIAEVDDVYVKVAKIEGTLAWHSHENEDELFYVLKGVLLIEMEDRTVELREGDSFVVPKGVRHNPIAKQECHVMLIERKSTLHTGSEVTEKTRTMDQQMRPI